MLYTFEQGSHLREAQIFTILVNLSGLQNYSFSFEAITLQGKIQEGQSINPRVIFHYVERSFCHHQHHLAWGPWERSTWKPRAWVCYGSFCHLQGTVCWQRKSILTRAAEQGTDPAQSSPKFVNACAERSKAPSPSHRWSLGLHQQDKGISVLCVPATCWLTFDRMSNRKEKTGS